MGSSRREIELEEQLKEASNLVLNPPASMDEKITLLDKVEHLLGNVEQAPSKSTNDALIPIMNGLIANDLLRHSDIDVRLSVTSCISEITRITAPESPYNDDLMKEIFQLMVSAFENLSHASGRYYMKALSILDTVAKVRSCLLMLDLECDKLVIEMFQHFLKVIRSDHPHVVFSAMETIMTLVIDESEDVSWDLLSVLLGSVRKKNQNVSPISWKLGEKVFTNCASKLKTYLKEAVQSRGIALDEYAEIVARICRSGDENPQHGHLVASENQLATKDSDPLCLGEVLHDVDGISKSVTSNGTAPRRNEGSVVKDQYIVECCSQVEHSQGVDTKCSTGAGTLDSPRNVKLEVGTESAPRKRGRKPNSLMNPEEGYDHSWLSGRKAVKVPRRKKTHDIGADCSPSVNHDSKKKTLNKTDSNLGDRTSASENSNHPEVSHHRKGRTKRQRSTMDQAGDFNSLLVSPSTQVSSDFSLRVEPEERSDTKRKRRKRTKSNEEINQTPEYGVSEKAANVPNAKKEKPWQLSVIKKRRRSSNDDESSVQENIKEGSVVAISAQSIPEASGAKKKKISKATAKSPNVDGKYSDDSPKTEFSKKHACGKEEQKAMRNAPGKSSEKDGYYSEETPKSKVKKKHSVAKKEKDISKACGKSSTRDGNHLEQTPATEVKKMPTFGKDEKISQAGARSSDRNCAENSFRTRVKRKHTAGRASETPVLGEQLVGSRIKVWWPMDKAFYDGSVESYDRIKKKHMILYSDGDEELLNLKKQRWELIKEGPSVISAAEQDTDVLKPDASSDIPPKEKDEFGLEQVKKVKASSLESTPPASATRAKTIISGSDSPVGATYDEPIKADESKADVSEKGSIPNSPAKLVLKDRKLIFTLSKPQQDGNTSKVESLNAGEGEGEAAPDSPVETSKDAMKGSTSIEVDNTNVDEEE